MSVEFNEPKVNVSMRASNRKPSFLISAVLKTGLVKTQSGAQVVLLIIAVLCLILVAMFFKGASQPLPTPTPEQVAT